MAIVTHYVTYGGKENRTAGTAVGYEDIAALIEDSAGSNVVFRETRSALSESAGVQKPIEDQTLSGGANNQVVQKSSGNQELSEASENQTEDKSVGFHIGHTTSIYADDCVTLIRVEYYDENDKLIYYSDVIDYDSSTKSYTENIYSYDEKNGQEVLERTDTYVNGVCSFAK